MFKELKYLFYLLVITLFLFLSIKFYFSDNNKKNSYRSFKKIDKKNDNYSQNIIFLKSDTVDIVEYVEKTKDRNKKNYNFWKLIKQ
tara:strand:- start:869 stop:1126 length:258 start_codon:yes stop_codon:yes gene_type:complete